MNYFYNIRINIVYASSRQIQYQNIISIILFKDFVSETDL